MIDQILDAIKGREAWLLTEEHIFEGPRAPLKPAGRVTEARLINRKTPECRVEITAGENKFTFDPVDTREFSAQKISFQPRQLIGYRGNRYAVFSITFK